MKCRNCGAGVHEGMEKCLYCGSYLPKVAAPKPEDKQPERRAAQVYAPLMTGNYRLTSRKSRWVAFVLCLCLGMFGIHKFYVGKTVQGVVYLFTFGLFGVGWLVDLVRILFGAFRDDDGRRLA